MSNLTDRPFYKNLFVLFLTGVMSIPAAAENYYRLINSGETYGGIATPAARQRNLEVYPEMHSPELQKIYLEDNSLRNDAFFHSRFGMVGKSMHTASELGRTEIDGFILNIAEGNIFFVSAEAVEKVDRATYRQYLEKLARFRFGAIGGLIPGKSTYEEGQEFWSMGNEETKSVLKHAESELVKKLYSANLPGPDSIILRFDQSVLVSIWLGWNAWNLDDYPGGSKGFAQKIKGIIMDHFQMKRWRYSNRFQPDLGDNQIVWINPDSHVEFIEYAGEEENKFQLVFADSKLSAKRGDIATSTESDQKLEILLH